MEYGHNMITLLMKGGIPLSTKTRSVVVYSEKTRDQPVPSQTSTISLTAEDTDENQVNPRGSRDYSFAVYFGLG